jgi:CheY-like chemotaxis protein
MNGAKILIAEDENIVALDIKNTLLKLGYKVTSIASTGIDVMTQIEQHKPDLILMDIMLKSALDGIDAAALISHKHKIPIIYVTSSTDKLTYERAKSTHPSDFIIKPFDMHRLQSAIEKVLNNQVPN